MTCRNCGEVSVSAIPTPRSTKTRRSISETCGTGTNRSCSGERAREWLVPSLSLSRLTGCCGRTPAWVSGGLVASGVWPRRRLNVRFASSARLWKVSGHRRRRNQTMKTAREQAWVLTTAFAFAGLFFLMVPNSWAQQENHTSNNLFNAPPCDYNDTFYMDNGINPTQLQGRFGSARQFGPPAGNHQSNWVADINCAANDPNRRNFRILATTGGYIDDGSGNATDFISLIAFVTSQSAFETSYSRTVGAIPAGG